jgi:hypothetical protein
LHNPFISVILASKFIWCPQIHQDSKAPQEKEMSLKELNDVYNDTRSKRREDVLKFIENPPNDYFKEIKIEDMNPREVLLQTMIDASKKTKNSWLGSIPFFNTNKSVFSNFCKKVIDPISIETLYNKDDQSKSDLINFIKNPKKLENLIENRKKFSTVDQVGEYITKIEQEERSKQQVNQPIKNKEKVESKDRFKDLKKDNEKLFEEIKSILALPINSETNNHIPTINTLISKDTVR